MSLKGRATDGAPGDMHGGRVGETTRLIKWLPLIWAMHMKGLGLLHDRVYASSLWDLPRYTGTGAGEGEKSQCSSRRQHCLSTVNSQHDAQSVCLCRRVCLSASARVRLRISASGKKKDKTVALMTLHPNY